MFPVCLSGRPQWPESLSLSGFINGEVIFPIGIHVLEPCRREMRQIVILHRVVFSTELV
jgi:hypothetical protein